MLKNQIFGTIILIKTYLVTHDVKFPSVRFFLIFDKIFSFTGFFFTISTYDGGAVSVNNINITIKL